MRLKPKALCVCGILWCIGALAANLIWDPSTDPVEQYLIHRYDVGVRSNFVLIGVSTTNHYYDATALPGSNYLYYVTCTLNNATSPPSNVVDWIQPPSRATRVMIEKQSMTYTNDRLRVTIEIE